MNAFLEDGKFSVTHHVKANKYPIFITVCFFLVMTYVTFFHHQFWHQELGIWYVQVGEQILGGDGQNTKVGDATYTGLIFYAILNSFFNDSFLLLKIISLLSMTGVVYFSYHIIKNIFGSKIAIVAQMFVVFTPQLDRVTLQALNDPLPIFFIFVALYFFTKKHLKLYDIIIASTFLALSTHFRFQAAFIFLALTIFLLIRDKKIKINLSHAAIFGIIFLIVLSPLFVYNYSMYGTILDSDANFYMLHKSKFQPPEWRDKLLAESYSVSLTSIFFIDPDIFLKNYFYNLFYHNPNILFNFNTLGSVSIFPMIAYLGLIPVFGGLVYALKIRLNKINLGILLGTITLTALMVFWLGDINYHFFAIFIIPFLVMGILHINNINKSLLVLLTLDVVFFLTISIVPLYMGFHLFPVWISTIALSAVFFVNIVPKITSKIQKNRLTNSDKPNVKTIVVIVFLILLINGGFSYKLLNAYLYDDLEIQGVSEEFSKLFQNRDIKDQNGYENKLVGEILSKQIGIEDSYVMSAFPIDAYNAKSNWLYTDYDEGNRADSFDKYITRENWSEFEIYYSNIAGLPTDRNNVNKPIPDYLVFDFVEGPDLKKYHEELSEPDNPKIPSNWEVLYKSDKTSMVVYKINHETKQ